MHKQLPREPWTEDEKSLLAKYYQNMNNEDLTLIIKNRTVHAISHKASKMKLRKSEAFLNSPNSGRFRINISVWQKIKNFIINLFNPAA